LFWFQGIGNEAAKEAEKHERLADNYNFVWKKTGQHDQKQEVTTSQSDQD